MLLQSEQRLTLATSFVTFEQVAKTLLLGLAMGYYSS